MTGPLGGLTQPAGFQPTGSTGVFNLDTPGSSPTANQSRGVCSLTWKSNTLRFRTNPNSMWWKYVLNTNIEQTYGGRVIQILSTKIDDLQVEAETGWGGWPYMQNVANFFRDMLVGQRDGNVGTFSYTARNIRLKVYATSIPFADQVSATSRKFTMTFKVQEDVSGLMTQMTQSAALSALQDGVGWQRNEYNFTGGGPPTPNGPGIPTNIGLGTGLGGNNSNSNSIFGQVAPTQTLTGALPGDPMGNILGNLSSLVAGGVGGSSALSSIFPLGIGANLNNVAGTG